MTNTESKSIELYWRPGCGFCMGLEHGLGKHEGLSINRHNIWDDPDAAAFVREHCNGNEVVPTVRVGNTVLVNPTTGEVLAAVAKEMPEALS
ncbi:MAG: NrdH-redoxin [Actinobacteria bacterium]|nr:NrdH-redoxin [Actinomycetota bacterium]